jgi:hypothetical protein
MLVQRQWARYLLVAAVLIFCRAPAWACDSEAGACSSEASHAASTAAAGAGAATPALSVDSWSAARRTGRKKVRFARKNARFARSVRSSRSVKMSKLGRSVRRPVAVARADAEEDAVPLPPTRSRAVTAGTETGLISVANPLPARWQPFSSAPLLAFEEPKRPHSTLPDAVSAARTMHAPSSRSAANGQFQVATSRIPASPVAQLAQGRQVSAAREASVSLPVSAPAPEQVRPVKAAAMLANVETSENSTLRTIFICVAGFLALGTVLRLAIG